MMRRIGLTGMIFSRIDSLPSILGLNISHRTRADCHLIEEWPWFSQRISTNKSLSNFISMWTKKISNSIESQSTSTKTLSPSCDLSVGFTSRLVSLSNSWGNLPVTTPKKTLKHKYKSKPCVKWFCWEFRSIRFVAIRNCKLNWRSKTFRKYSMEMHSNHCRIKSSSIHTPRT